MFKIQEIAEGLHTTLLDMLNAGTITTDKTGGRPQKIRPIKIVTHKQNIAKHCTLHNYVLYLRDEY